METLPLREIEPDPDQPRKTFEQETLSELAASIAEHGLLQPENSLGPHIPGWSLWLQCLAHWLWLSCSKIPFAEKQKVCCASTGPA